LHGRPFARERLKDPERDYRLRITVLDDLCEAIVNPPHEDLLRDP